MEFRVKAIAELKLDFNPTNNEASENFVNIIVKSTDSELDGQLYTETGDLTRAGAVAMTNAFVAGLVAGIDVSCHLGVWDKEEHLQFALKSIDEQINMERQIFKGDKS